MLFTFPSKGSFQAHNNVLSPLALAFLCTVPTVVLSLAGHAPKRHCSSDKASATAYTSPCDLKMPLPTLAEIDEEIRQVTLLTAWHEELARNAQASEEVCGDLAVSSEANTNSFMDDFHQLKVVFHYFVSLHTNGWLQPKHLASLQHHFQKNLEYLVLSSSLSFSH